MRVGTYDECQDDQNRDDQHRDGQHQDQHRDDQHRDDQQRTQGAAWALVRAGLAAGLATAVGLLAAPAVAASPSGPTATGGDVSWPQCGKGVGRGYGLPMPDGPLRFVVLGVNEGSSGFTRNPCLRQQRTWAQARGLWTGVYTVPGYPTPAELARYGAAGPYSPRTPTGRAANAGTAQARATIATMRAAGLARTPTVWLDVENPPLQPWTRDPARNIAVLRGVMHGFRAAGYRVGVYTYPYGWYQITGGWRPGVPMWATGTATRAAALTRCRTPPAATGGHVLLSQWWVNRGGHGVLYDVTCPVGGMTRPSRSPLYPYRAQILRYGDRGAAVAAVQRSLGVRPVTGVFGPVTRRAVVRWARGHRLPATATVTPATWRTLGAGALTPGIPAVLPRLFLRP